MHLPYSRCRLYSALALALAIVSPAMAQQVVADGDEQNPAAGDYATTEPVEPGNPAGHAFLAVNGGTIIPAGEVNLRTDGLRAAAARAEGVGSSIQLNGGQVMTTGRGAAGLSASAGGHVQAVGTRIETLGTTSHGAESLAGRIQLERVDMPS